MARSASPATAVVSRAKRKPRPARFGRGDRSALGTWFWEIDRVLLLLVAGLIGIGLIAVAAASPAAAVRYSGGSVTFPPLYYLYRQLVWLGVGLPVMLAVSMLPKEAARRFAVIGAGVFLLLLALVPFVGVEANGARRWIGAGFAQLQPSEFLKPLFVVTLAWIFSLGARDKSLPVVWLTAGLTGCVALLLMKQPDFGQTVIFLSIWLSLLMLSGVQMKWLAALGAAGVGGIVAAYLFYPVATARIDKFLTGTGDTYQMDSAHNTLVNGGLIGMGPGAGTMKFRLPEPHTDYIFSVIGEEFGLLACLAIALLYLAIVVRVFIKLLDEKDEFLLFAAAGLVVQFGLQALINMAVNVGIAPSKGMTLPFISYGGSSMIALSVGFGLLLAFTRRNPYLTRSPYVVTWSGR
ncbi:FtsW/RodA/SpoVE family cell cycle protein [Sphingomonas jatrophae]|uniref:Probable peptidoglycan glycosyltransferase FtsW n=1 Tax=Sphingomonas jatrophae TaxID=1166337 RepID=A0A1I6M6L5_9SPHN|nr:putative peptidoglycan glycosyltransferase FtsW [Sphingomonas jatrophae]SFS11359.1 cell division protein FtsW [Sphingomonas jatrophae]